MVATRTWVSGVGDDANPCSRTAPCKTFAGAISKTTARGEIDALDPGGFGAVTITKSITIDGGQGSGLASILASSTNGIVINAAANDIVTLRNLSINGGNTGFVGIRILSAGALFIENCAIFNFRASGANVGRGISDVRTGGGRLFVTNCMIRDNAEGGIVISATAGSPRITATLSNVRLLGNRDGLVVTSGATAMVRAADISNNTGVGVSAQEPPGTVGDTEVNLESCVISYNNIGVTVQTGTPTIRLSNSTVTGNATGIFVVNGVVNTFGNNRIAGNISGNAIPAGSGIPLQ